jgi:hypothetical protein
MVGGMKMMNGFEVIDLYRPGADAERRSIMYPDWLHSVIVEFEFEYYYSSTRLSQLRNSSRPLGPLALSQRHWRKRGGDFERPD